MPMYDPYADRRSRPLKRSRARPTERRAHPSPVPVARSLLVKDEVLRSLLGFCFYNISQVGLGGR